VGLAGLPGHDDRDGAGRPGAVVVDVVGGEGDVTLPGEERLAEDLGEVDEVVAAARAVRRRGLDAR